MSLTLTESQNGTHQGETRNRTITINLDVAEGSDVIVNINGGKKNRSMKNKNQRIKEKTFMERNFKRRCKPSHSNINC